MAFLKRFKMAFSKRKIKKKEVIFKKDKEKVCLTCLQGNRKQNIVDVS